MKIIFFSPTLNVGGYEKVVLEFANYLINDNKNQIVIACCHGNGEIAQLFGLLILNVELEICLGILYIF